MEIFRTKTYRKAVKKLGASEAELKAVEDEIAANPTAGDVIQGTGGARKIRFAFGGKGKRGAGRAIYVAMIEDDLIYMLMAYSKAERDDLTKDDKDAIKEFIDEL